MKNIIIDDVPQAGVLTVGDLKKFFAWAELVGENIDDVPIHVLDITDDENSAGYATHVEMDAFDSDEKDHGIKVVSILRWPERKRIEYPADGQRGRGETE